MSITVTLVTVYQVIGDTDDGNPRAFNQFFETAESAHEASIPQTWSRKGRKPDACEAVKFPDGTIRVLGETVIPSVSTADNERQKKAALAKLTPRERQLLGLE